MLWKLCVMAAPDGLSRWLTAPHRMVAPSEVSESPARLLG